MLRDEWEPCIAFIKWSPTTRRKYSRSRILKCLKAHQTSEVRYLSMLRADILLLLKRKNIGYKDVAELIERAIHTELNKRVSVITKSIALIRDILIKSESLLLNAKRNHEEE